jgi:hypothetical protein
MESSIKAKNSTIINKMKIYSLVIIAIVMVFSEKRMLRRRSCGRKHGPWK